MPRFAWQPERLAARLSSVKARADSSMKYLSTHKKAATAVGVLFAATLLGGGLNFGVQVLLARALSVEQFGTFGSALAIVTLVAPLAGFGLPAYWLNLYGREGWEAQRWLPASFRFLSISTTLVLAAVVVWAWIGPHDDHSATLLVLLSTVVIGQVAVELGSVKYQLEGRHIGLALWQFLPHFLRFVGVAVLVVVANGAEFTPTHAASVFAIVAMMLLVLGALQMLKLMGGKFVLDGHSGGPRATSMQKQFASTPALGKVISGTWPFGLAGVFYLIYFQSDIILIKYLVGESAAGLYNVAFIVMAAVYLFPSVLYQKYLLPKLHRWAHHDTKKFIQVHRVGNMVMLTIGFVAMLLLWLLAPPVVPRLFGHAYSDSVLLVSVLALAVPLRFLASSAGAMLATRDYMRLKVKLMGMTALANVALNLLLIPKYAAVGAAVATVVSDALLCGCYLIQSKKLLTQPGTL